MPTHVDREVQIVLADGTVVGATNPLPTSGGGGGGGATTIADGADTAEGATTDVAVTGDTAGTVSAKLRGFNKILFDVWDSVNHWLVAGAKQVTSPWVSTGDIAHGSADGGNTFEVGFQAIAHGTNPTPVTAGQRTRGYANEAGVPFVIGGHPNIVTYTQNFTTAQTDTALVTVSAGTKIVVTGYLVTCSHANTVDVGVRIGFGAAVVPAYGNNGIIGSHPNVAAGGGFGEGGGAGIVGTGADGEDVRVTLSVPTSGSVDVKIRYYTVPS